MWCQSWPSEYCKWWLHAAYQRNALTHALPTPSNHHSTERHKTREQRLMGLALTVAFSSISVSGSVSVSCVCVCPYRDMLRVG